MPLNLNEHAPGGLARPPSCPPSTYVQGLDDPDLRLYLMSALFRTHFYDVIRAAGVERTDCPLACLEAR